MSADEEKKPRGLWDVMRSAEQTATVDPQPTPAEESTRADEQTPDSEDTPSPKGLWAVMGRPGEASQSSLVQEHDAPPPPAGEEQEVRETAPEEHIGTPLSAQRRLSPTVLEKPQEAEPQPVARPQGVLPPTDPIRPPVSLAKPARRLAAQSGLATGAVFSAIGGVFGLGMTALALLPSIWARLPATILGFFALTIGIMSLSEIRNSRGRQTGSQLAMFGMCVGVIAMFLGPLVVSPWGDSQRRKTGRQRTIQNLAAIGDALDAYHSDHERYPPGTSVGQAGGETEHQELHSWMTYLLPHLDETSFARNINYELRWNSAFNAPVMKHVVPAFQAGGHEKHYDGRRYALAHFAALGGSVRGDHGRMIAVGVFERNSSVAQADVLDGLSTTLIAGEVADGYSPWGRPGNWRRIGRGINHDPSGFGNPARTGAHFLHGDGGVRFYSNSVDSEVLLRLSTRNGRDGDGIPMEYQE